MGLIFSQGVLQGSCDSQGFGFDMTRRMSSVDNLKAHSQAM